MNASRNVIDCTAERAAIGSTLARALAMKGQRFENVYGDGHAGAKIVELLAGSVPRCDAVEKEQCLLNLCC